MIPNKKLDVLKILYSKLLGVDWRLVGSTNLSIQGVKVDPKDIDIMINIKDIKNVQIALSDYCKKQIEYSENNGYSSIFGQFIIMDVQVDIIAGELQKDGKKVSRDVFTKKPKIIEFDGIFIPCMDLNTEYRAYMDMYRYEKAALIKLAIDNNI